MAKEKTAVETVKISDLLMGCVAGRMQSVGCMQVIPLVSDITDDRFVSPAEAKVSTEGYGSLVFKNTTPKTMIVPAQAAYIVKEAAQDHALPHAGIVKKSAKKTFTTAMCVQQTQGGYIREGDHTMVILPFMLREKAHEIRKDINYSRLWASIEQLNSAAGIRNGGGHLNIYFDTFAKELDQFVAEFEPVAKQVGAIILVGGEVVGIERAPNYKFWKSVWGALIRECYGSLALVYSKNVKVKPATRSAIGKVDSLAMLKAALKKVEGDERDKAKSLVNELLEIQLEAKRDFEEEGLTVDALANDRFVGQVVREGKAILYGTVIETAAWRKGSDWMKKATPFKM